MNEEAKEDRKVDDLYAEKPNGTKLENEDELYIYA